MKKISLLLILMLFALAASGSYGYYTLVLDEDDADSDDTTSSGSTNAPIAKIDPPNPKIQVDTNITFTGSKSTDADNDALSYVWTFAGDNKQYEGESIERNYPEEGEFEVKLMVTDSTGLSDEAITTVTVISNYHEEFSGTLGEGQSETITFPVESGAVSLEVDWNLTDENQGSVVPPSPGGGSTVNMHLEDSEGNILESENNTEEGSGSWSVIDDRLETTGTYSIVIECTNGEMSYEIVVNVKY